MKKYLEQLHSKRVFHFEDISNMTENANTAKDLLLNYKRKNLIVKIRRDLYSVTELSSKATIANKFEIGSNISLSSYISYHSAFEYHGIANQVFYDLYISSETRFNDFDFEGIHYSYCNSIIDMGIETNSVNSLIRVTNLERTVIDCIDRIDRAGGLEELIQCLAMLRFLDEDKLIEYLSKYNKIFLYKKVGFVLDVFKEELKLSNNFIDLCHKKGHAHVKYLTDNSESDTFNKYWNIYAPKDILSYLEQGNNEFV
ncbi:MAG: hypothetical protein H6Q15_1888 [Bacteroidetes bacterium]|nr:hypothetical protein [Bacteroidota bacterium]